MTTGNKVAFRGNDFMHEALTRIPDEFVHGLACPCCHSASLELRNGGLHCVNQGCGAVFPLVDGRPILLNEQHSIFSARDFIDHRPTTMDLRDEVQKGGGILQYMKRLIADRLPDLSYSSTDLPLDRVLERIREACGNEAKILVIGAGEQQLDMSGGGNVLYTDVAIGPLTHLVCDAHDLPFVGGLFDAVIANAVLEHVADPYRCVDEIYRVLKPDGFVFAVTPFMQQVHMAQYDFTRFTYLGHRRLFRRFTEERSGVANGPGMALAWSFERFVAAFAVTRRMHGFLRSLARLLIFPFKYCDKILSRHRAAYDSASAFYFLGRKSEMVLSDRQLISLYRGLG